MGLKPFETVDAIFLGAPHYGMTEVQRLLARISAGVSLRIPVYISLGRDTLAELEGSGEAARLADAGIECVVDTCTYYSPSIADSAHHILTDSAKWVAYASANLKASVSIASLEECLEAACAGQLPVRSGYWDE